MLTPQEIQEVTFDKAVFGGYDMQTVDAFVEPLIKDYEALYNENAVLKGKLRVLVRKLEEFRDQEESVKQAMVSAQKTCSTMIKEAEEKCAAMLADAEERTQQVNMDALIDEEQARLEYAKKTALNFIQCVEQDIRGHLDLLEKLKERDLSTELEQPAKPAPKEEKVDFAKAIAEEIQGRLSDELGLPQEEESAEEAPAEVSPVSADTSPTIKFPDLQFGKNYNPTGNK